MPRGARMVPGLVVVLAAVWCIAHPVAVGEALGRPAARSSSEMINLRASWGGTLLGLGLALAFVPRLRPWVRAGLGLLMWLMIGIGLARVVGFVLDGEPDALQWVWLAAEMGLATLFAALLRRGRPRA